MWLRNRETGEAVKVVETGAMARYQNADPTSTEKFSLKNWNLTLKFF